MNIITLILLSIWFIFSMSPLMMIKAILVLSIYLCILLSFSSSWVSYFLFLIFVGGLMILFMYMSTLAESEAMKISVTAGVGLLLLPSHYPFKLWTLKNMFLSELIFLHPYLMFILLLISYLLLMLMIVIKIIFFNKSPMRKSN